MYYKLPSGKQIKINDHEIENLMEHLDLTKQEAIQTYLEDNGELENEEQNALDEKARKVSINRDAGKKSSKKTRKKPEIKISDEKKTLFKEISNFLDDFCENYSAEVAILKENKLFSLKVGEKTFKIDIIEQRPPKKAEDI